jgi:hypothetical protein
MAGEPMSACGGELDYRRDVHVKEKEIEGGFCKKKNINKGYQVWTSGARHNKFKDPNLHFEMCWT